MKKIVLSIALVIAVGQTTRAQVSYIERSWDAENKKVVETVKTCSNYTEITGQKAGSWIGLDNNKWYVVKESNVKYQTINVLGSNVHLILCDGARINLTGGVKLEGSTTLTVYGQTEDSGILSAYNEDYSDTAGLGSAEKKACGNLIVHGGTVYATGIDNAAGIGGGQGASSGNLTMYGGRIYSTGGDRGAGIGGGEKGGIGGTVNIYGGSVTAIGGVYGAGIGGGDEGNQGGTVNIYGGNVTASGKFDDKWLSGGGAGIGGGDEGSGGNVNIYDGEVRAYGRGYAAGIGGGQNRGISGKVQISGGKVEAWGYENSIHFPDDKGSGAGIGGGEGGGQGGDVVITGGNVTARGGHRAAGIGGGAYYNGGAQGGKVIITGGTVLAVCGKFCNPSESSGGCAIGSGYHSSEHGTIEFGMMMVSAGADEWHLTKVNPWTSRESSGHSSGAVKVEPCDHIGEGGSVYGNINADTHGRGICIFCGTHSDNEAHTFGSDGACPCGLLGLQDKDSNASWIETWNEKNRTVALEGRTLYKDGSWNTLCLPFSLTEAQIAASPLVGADIRTLSGASFKDGTLTLNFTAEDAVTSITAGKPYIVKWTDGSDIANPIFRDVTISNSYNPVETEVIDFVGTYNPVDIGEEGDNTKLYLGNGNTLYYPSKAMSINAFRAYFQLKGDLTTGEQTSTEPGQQTIKAFNLNFGEETGIREISESSEYSENSDYYYSHDGRRLLDKPTTHGLYIHNGRKVLIK